MMSIVQKAESEQRDKYRDIHNMGTCKNHPDRQTNYICQKHNYYLCEECLACADPKLYCKFRSSCIIFFKTKKSDSIGTDPQTAEPEKEEAHE